MKMLFRLIRRFWIVAALLLLFTVLQVGFLHFPSPHLFWSGDRVPSVGVGSASSAAPATSTGGRVFTSTSVISPVFTSTTLVEVATPTASPTASPTPSSTPTPTNTPRPTTTPSPTFSPTPTATPSPAPTPTFTVTPTPTPLPTRDGTARTAHVPILMYHYISVPPADADIYRLDLSVTPANFETQLAWLRSEGYEGITLTQLVYHLALGWPLPEKPVILTFDDGYRDNYVNAFPLLVEYGYPGTFFLHTQPIDEDNPAYLTWGMVGRMHRAGMDMQAHGYRPRDLSGKSVDYLVYEIVGAKEAIEARTGEPVRFFSYPSGQYDQQTIAVLRSADFWAAVTTVQGTTHSSTNLFELERVRMRGRHSLDDFVEVVTANW